MKTQEGIQRGGWSPGLIELGAQGVHPLFDSDCIHRAFARIDRGRITEKGVLSAHDALRDLSAIQGVWGMQKYLKSLPSETLDLLVYLYFRSLDEFLEGSPKTIH